MNNARGTCSSWNLSVILAAIAGAVIAASARANALTAAERTTLFQGVIGNALLGVLEAVVVIVIVRPRRMLAVGIVALLVAANYASFIVGAAFIGITRPMETWFPETDLLRSGLTIAAIVFVALLLITLSVEWLFYLACCARRERPLRTSLRTLLIAHAVSVPALIGFYALDGGWTFSLYTRLRYDQSLAFVREHHPVPLPWVYYIHKDGGSVWRVRLDGGGREMIGEIEPHPGKLRLIVWPNPGGGVDVHAGWFDVLDEKTEHPRLIGTPLLTVEMAGARGSMFAGEEPGQPADEHRYTYGTAHYLTEHYFATLNDSPKRRLRWHSGLIVEDIDTGARRTLGFDNPMSQAMLTPLQATYAPHEFIVMTLGRYSVAGLGERPVVAVLSLDAQTIGVLAEGSSPVVVYEHDELRPSGEPHGAESE